MFTEKMTIAEVSTALSAICCRCKVQVGQYCINDDEDKGILTATTATADCLIRHEQLESILRTAAKSHFRQLRGFQLPHIAKFPKTPFLRNVDLQDHREP
jgi:hypothetical protein